MDPKFTQSFIPKKPVVLQGRVGHTTRRQTALMPFVGGIIFLLVLVGSVGVFSYQQYLLKHISDLDSKLVKAQSSLDSDEVVDTLIALDGRLKSAHKLLLEHISTTAFFELLQSLTLQNVQFTDFSYTINNLESGIGVEMRGRAKNYATLVLQSDVLNESEQVKNSTFSDLDLDNEGNVLFRLSVVFDAKSLLYKDSLQSLSFGGFPY
ncbi:MAG: hypothetical protein AAB706_03965 [Patescibacteria group bacterium]